MKKVYVEKGKVVVELEGVKVHYDMYIIEKRINSLLQDLEEWRKYQRLLTPDAADGALRPQCPVCGTREHYIDKKGRVHQYPPRR
jgi:hypothetical protein